MSPFWHQSLLTLSFSLIIAGCSGSSTPGPEPTPEPGPQEISITSASGAWQKRLPCEGREGEFCHLTTYQIMTESFVNGDGNIGYGVGYGTSHHSGDIQGVIDSLDYIAGLGLNAVWLTPVFKSAASGKIDATGYFPKDYFTIDPNFGDLDKAKELVQKAHEKGLYVFFDGVFGHHSSNVELSPKGLQASDGVVQNPGYESVFPADLAFYQEVVSYWTSELCLDGWRLDQAYQVPLEQWQELDKTLKDVSVINEGNAACEVNGKQWGTLAYMVAEILSGDPAVISSGAYGTSYNPALPSAFDFPRRYALLKVLAVEESGTGGLPTSELVAAWNNHATYPLQAQPNLMLGNHDLVRFGDLIQRGGLGETNNDNYWLRHKAAFSYMAAYSGPITFYYGEEIGDEVPGFSKKVSSNCADQGLCDDHVSRSSGKIENVTDFVPNATQKNLKTYLSDLMKIRAQYPALYKGKFQHLYASGNLYADLKEYDSAPTDSELMHSEQILYLLNTDTASMTVTLAAALLNSDASQLTDLMDGSVIQINADNFEIQLSKLSGRLLLVE